MRGRPCLDTLRKVSDCIAIAKHGSDPRVLKAVRQLAEHREGIAESAR
jgi:hypothetical protein